MCDRLIQYVVGGEAYKNEVRIIILSHRRGIPTHNWIIRMGKNWLASETSFRNSNQLKHYWFYWFCWVCVARSTETSKHSCELPFVASHSICLLTFKLLSTFFKIFINVYQSLYAIQVLVDIRTVNIQLIAKLSTSRIPSR